MCVCVWGGISRTSASLQARSSYRWAGTRSAVYTVSSVGCCFTSIHVGTSRKRSAIDVCRLSNFALGACITFLPPLHLATERPQAKMLSYLKKFGSPDADTAAKIGASLFVLKDHWHDASAYSLLSALVAAADHYGRENGVFHSLEIAVMKEYRSSIVSFLSSQLEAACSLPDGPFEFAFTKPGHCAYVSVVSLDLVKKNKIYFSLPFYRYSLFLKAQRVSDVLKAMEDGQEFVDGSVKVTTVDPKEEIKHKKEDKENACGDEDGEDDEDEVVSDTYDSHVGHVIITAIAEVNQANIIVELLLSVCYFF